MACKNKLFVKILLSALRGFGGIGAASLVAVAIGFPGALYKFWVACGQGNFFELTLAFSGLCFGAFILIFAYLYCAHLCGQLAEETLDAVLPVAKNEWGEPIENRDT